MSNEAKQLIAAQSTLYYMGRAHSPICECPICKAWSACDEFKPEVFAEVDELSGRKPEPAKEL